MVSKVEEGKYIINVVETNTIDEMLKHADMLLSDRPINTRMTYLTAFRKFLKFTKKQICDITPEDIFIYKSYRLKNTNDKKKRSLKTELAGIKTIFNLFNIMFLPSEKYNIDFLKRIFKVDISLPLIRIFSDEDVGKILTFSKPHSRASDVKKWRNYTIILVLFKTGVRLGELVNIKINDIDIENKVIYIHGIKREDDRIVYYDNETARAIRHYLKLRPSDTSEKFINLSSRFIYAIFKDIVRKATGKNTGHPHLARHTLLTKLAPAFKGVDGLRQLMRISGHKKADSLMRYIHSNDQSLIRERYYEIMGEKKKNTRR